MSQRRACVKNVNVPLIKPVKVMQLFSIQKRKSNSLVCIVCVCPQLCFVYWDMSRCLRTLTETLEEGSSFVSGDIQVSRTLFALPPPDPLSILPPHLMSVLEINTNISGDAAERIFYRRISVKKLSG